MIDENDAPEVEGERTLHEEDEDAPNELTAVTAEMERGVVHVLALMSNSQPEDVGNVTEAFHEHVTLVRLNLSEQQCCIYTDKLTAVGGGIIITDYLKFLYWLGLADDTVYKCYCDIFAELVNLTFYSRLLTVALAENGMFDLLNKQITYLTNKLTDDGQVQHVQIVIHYRIEE